MADFYVKMPRDLTEHDAEKLRGKIAYTEAVYPDSDQPSGRPLSTLHVRNVNDEQDAKRRVIDLLGLDEQEAASLTAWLAAEHSN